ncbi:MAG: Crp/Fnr family transcriptional regulator [Solirubrobacteraceae bacterium]
MTEHPHAAATRAVPCLADLTDEEAAAAAPHLLIRSLAPGEVLFRQGDPGASVYVLVSGEVEIRVPGTDGDHELATIGPGTFVGEFALLADTRRTRSVVAGSQAELWELPRADFESALASGEPWATRFLMSVARELARQMLAVDRQIAALMEADRDQPSARVRELEKLRRQLSGEWKF